MTLTLVNTLEPPAGEATPKPEAGDASQGEGSQLEDSQAGAQHCTRPLADPSPLPFLARCNRPQIDVNAGARIALFFPGRWPSCVGMLADYQKVPGVGLMFAKAKDILGHDIVDVCLKGSRSKLSDPRYGNAAAFLAGLVGLTKLHLEDGQFAGCFHAVSGRDFGHFTALCAAGALTFEDGLKCVQAFGEAELFDECHKRGGMVAVYGLDTCLLWKLCRQAARTEGASSVCQVIQELSPTCNICSGTKEAISRLAKLADSAGAHRVTMSRSVGWCTPLVKSLQEKHGKIYREVLPRMSPLQCELYLDVTGLPSTDPAEIVRLMTDAVTRPRSLAGMVRNMITDGVTKFIEIGPQMPTMPISYIVSQIDDTPQVSVRYVKV
mmetsp:Transcript_127420/g.354697  ORF Transcript_127420/g.354697 Transcript_127420/m.354697 type:complete len:380 (+) Transcript_127420:76-1215(+)